MKFLMPPLDGGKSKAKQFSTANFFMVHKINLMGHGELNFATSQWTLAKNCKKWHFVKMKFPDNWTRLYILFR